MELCINNQFLTDALVLILYTEMHFKFRFPFSRYFSEEPEILADIPHRINPNEDIPLLLLIKDSDRFPIQLENVIITILQRNKLLYSKTFEFNLDLSQQWWYQTIHILRESMQGIVEVNVKFNYSKNNKHYNCINHNLKLLSPSPLKTYLSENSYPGCIEVQWADLHYHSNFTEDMVEFGAPLESTIDAAKSMGINSIACTDHSYDLDDIPGSWTKPDPELVKWNRFLEEVHHLNNRDKFTILLLGEELSLKNCKNRIVHLLIINSKKFFYGQGDSAEKPFNFECDHSIQSLENELDDNSLCIAAHPNAQVPLTQMLLLKRGKWNLTDLKQKYILGMQILNGSIDEGFRNGKKKWISLLLQGFKKFIYAGNDAHGNFNIFRQIDTPMLSLKEKDEQIFAECRTGYFPEKKRDIQALLTALKKGNCFITNGPYLKINFTSDGQNFAMGSEVIAKNGSLEIFAKSTIEFGNINKVKIFQGLIRSKSETIILTDSLSSLEYSKRINLTITKHLYFRAEIESTNYRGKRIAMTNPIWVNPSNEVNTEN